MGRHVSWMQRSEFEGERWMKNVYCTGDESALHQCDFTIYIDGSCGDYPLAVKCCKFIHYGMFRLLILSPFS